MRNLLNSKLAAVSFVSLSSCVLVIFLNFSVYSKSENIIYWRSATWNLHAPWLFFSQVVFPVSFSDSVETCLFISCDKIFNDYRIRSVFLQKYIERSQNSESIKAICHHTDRKSFQFVINSKTETITCD